MKDLSILTLGAGAIGTYIGGSLALAGHRVTFVERPEVAEDLRARGLRLKLGDGEHHLAAPVVIGSLDEALASGKYDIAIFALKSYHTPAFIDSLSTHHGTLPPILCLSNGVDNELALAEKLGREKVIAGTVTTAIGRNAAGDITLEKLRGLGIANEHPLAGELAQAMTDAGLNAQLFERAADMKWSKMLTNLIANASAAILDMTPAEIFAHPGIFAIEMAQLREALRVMRAQGIRVVDLPGTPVRALAFAVRWLPMIISRPLLAKAVGGGRGGKMPSFHIDLHSGSGKSEVEYLNGAVARAGAQQGIPTPVNQLLNDTLIALTRGEMPLDAYRKQPEKLL
ncbi:MAG: 2-dehydropantoate 2-reductase [Chloroflexi bacterium]|jgi:2-dehydropantoate 2-reductase|nr:2-dehydropantoate 2-reductase [Chloroflexota bacterium]